MHRLVPFLLALCACNTPQDVGEADWTPLPVADAPPPTLFPGISTTDFLPGQPFDVVVRGVPERTRVYLFASLGGIQTDAGPCAPLGGGCLDLAPTVVTLDTGLANADGEVIFTVGPPPPSAVQVTFQAGAYHRQLGLSGVTPTVPKLLQDADLDGVITADDCDDNDPSVYAWVSGYADADADGEAAGATAVELCTDGSLPAGYIDTPGADCDDLDDGTFPGALEVCDGLADNNCDGRVDEGCPSNDPFNAVSCQGTPWTEVEAMDYLAGRSRVVLAAETIQERQCPGGICGGPMQDWSIRYLTYSGGVSTRWRNVDATMELVLFNDGGSPALSIQHTSFDAGNYDDDEGMVYGFPPQLITYPRIRAYNTAATGSDYIDLDYQVAATEIVFGDGCVRWAAEPFGQALTQDWAVRFEW